MPSLDVRPPDLEMRIRMVAEHGKRSCAYPHRPTARSHSIGRRRASCRGTRRTTRAVCWPRSKNLLITSTSIGRRSQEEVENKLASLGRDLCASCFPSSAFSTGTSCSKPTWVIVSDEPWIPWELVKNVGDASRRGAGRRPPLLRRAHPLAGGRRPSLPSSLPPGGRRPERPISACGEGAESSRI